MKTFKIFGTVLAFMAITASVQTSFAQGDNNAAKDKATKVDKFEAGKSLTQSDIGFLDLIANSDKGKSRGKGEVKEVTVHKTKFTAGHKLTADDASLIAKTVASYRGVHKVEKDEAGSKSRGSTCYYYCYYNAYGDYVCYWYCY